MSCGSREKLSPSTIPSFPRFASVATFMRLPSVTDISKVDIGLVGVPFDGGTTNRPGARHAPREVRSASTLMRPLHPIFKFSPYDLCAVGDIGDVPINPINASLSLEIIESFFRQFKEESVVPLSIGGDHLVTLPILRGITTGKPLGLVHIDAHSDTTDENFGSRYTHATTFRRAIEEGLIDPARTVQIGIRGSLFDEDEFDWALAQGVTIISIEQFNEMGLEAVLQIVRDRVGQSPAYLSFDIDGIDPVWAPGTGTPEICGLTSFEAVQLLRGLRGLTLVGADIVEISPPFDNGNLTSLLGASLMFEALCLLAEVRSLCFSGSR